MRAADLADLLSVTIPGGLPTLIKGAPGIGKTDIVKAAAKACEANLILTHPVVSEPIDYKGLPALVPGKNGKQRAEFLPFGDLRRLIAAKSLTVCFLDDLGQAPASVQAAAMQLILARRVNRHKVSDHVVFLAATNRRQDRAGVTGILEPVKSRFTTIIELTVNVDDWCTWALANDVAPEVVAFIRFRPELLMDQGTPTNDIVNRPSPRTVVGLSNLYQQGIRSTEAFAGAVGEGFATQFSAFLRLWQSLPSIEDIFSDPDNAPVPTEPSTLYAVSMAVAYRTTGDTAQDAMTYAQRLPDEFGVLTIRSILARCPAATDNAAFVQWAVDHPEILN